MSRSKSDSITKKENSYAEILVVGLSKKQFCEPRRVLALVMMIITLLSR